MGDKRTFSRPNRQMGIDLNRMHTLANQFDVIPSHRENCKQLPRVVISISLCGLDPMPMFQRLEYMMRCCRFLV